MVKARGQITITDNYDGNSVTIKSTEVSYQLSNSGTAIPTGAWQKNVLQTTDTQPYLWTRTIVNYSDGKSPISYSVGYKGKDGISVGRNLALGTSGEWSNWISLGSLSGINRIYSKNITLCDTVPTTMDISFSIEIEISEVTKSTDAGANPIIMFQGNNQGVSDWGLGGGFNDTTLADGIYSPKFHRKPARESNILGWQLRVDNATIKFRYRCIKIEYGTVPTAYIPNEADLKGDQGDAATSYYINPEAIVITERVNGITFGDDDTYTAKDYTYDIDHTIAIHKAVGNVDTIVKADSISVIEGGKLGLDTSKLQASYKDGTGYQLSSAITNSGLEGDTSINKIVVQFSVGAIKLLCPVYINRLGTVTTQTVGDATQTVRTKVVDDVTPSIDAAQKEAKNASEAAQKAQDSANSASTAANNAQSAANKAQGTADSAQKAADKAQNTANAAVTQTTFEAYKKETSEEFSQKYSETSEIINNVAAGEGSAVDIDLTGKDENTFYLVTYGITFRNAREADMFVFGVSKTLYAPYDAKTSYGKLAIENGKGGFETYLQWQEHYMAWGSREADRSILKYTKLNIGDTFAVGSVGQYKANGPVYVYLRGGAKYHCYSDHTGVDIKLATQSDIDAFYNPSEIELRNDPIGFTKPSLKKALANVVEPVTEKTVIYSEIKQTADNISATITDGLTSTGIDIKSHKITSKADNFEWDDNSGNPIARFGNANGATFNGNVSAKTLSTNSGKSRIDEDGILHAKGADLNGTLTTNEGTTRAVLSGGGLQMFDNEVLQTEHTGKTFATANSILPSKDGATISIPTNAQEVTTETVGAGESKTTALTLATFTATANGVFKLDISDLHAQILGDVEDASQNYGPRLYIELLLNDTRVWSDFITLRTYSYSYVLREDPFSIKKYINAGQKYTLTLGVTIDTISQSSTQTPKVHGTCSVTLQSAKIASDSYLSMFFGNGLMFAKDYNHYIISMLENNIMKFEARNGNNGVSFDGDGIKMLAANGNWYKQPITVACLRISCESNPSIIYSSESGFEITADSAGQYTLKFPSSYANLKLGTKGFLEIASYTGDIWRQWIINYRNLTDTSVQLAHFQDEGKTTNGGYIDIEIKIRP